jgi:hypothetical protein
MTYRAKIDKGGALWVALRVTKNLSVKTKSQYWGRTTPYWRLVNSCGIRRAVAATKVDIVRTRHTLMMGKRSHLEGRKRRIRRNTFRGFCQMRMRETGEESFSL